MATENRPEKFPPTEALPRSVLVRNISPLATPATIEDFFSFCGSIESQRLQKSSGSSGTQIAVVIFSDELARDNALVMDQSSIVDTLVTITPVPYAFNLNEEQGSETSQTKPGLWGSGLSAFGDLFSGVGTAVAAEVGKASHAIDRATDVGVLRTAKDQVAYASRCTKDFATDLDNKWHVSENARNAASAGKTHATAVASVVATQTSNIVSQVDRNLHISENTGLLAERARENATVNSGIRAVTGSFQSILAQTGLQRNQGQTLNSNGSSEQPLGQELADDRQHVSSTLPQNGSQ